MSHSKKYYYQGYECLATYQEKTGQWHCVVENVTYPFAFEASEERFIQGNFEHDLQAYIERCLERGIAPKKESALHRAEQDRHFAITSGMRKQEKERAKKERRKQREFDRSYWKYLVPVVLAGVPAIGYAMMMWVGRSFPFTIFFPYRANVQIKRFPALTLAVCLLCTLVFIGQFLSDKRFERDCQQFSKQKQFTEFFTVMWTGAGLDATRACYAFAYISNLKDPEGYIEEYAAKIIDNSSSLRPYTVEELSGVMKEAYRAQMQTVPLALSRHLVFKSNQFDFIGAYTAVFAHADWSHILFNLIFFFAFAASVEVLAGHLVFLLMFAVIPPLIAVFDSDSYMIAGEIHGNSSLGLSGMCLAFMACLLALKPKLEIKTLFWFVILLRSYNVPIWFLATWYVSADLSALINNADDGIGHIAHFVGACTGAVAGYICKIVMQKQLNHDALVDNSTEEQPS